MASSAERLSTAKEGSKEQKYLLETAARVAGEVLTRCGGEVKEVVAFLGGKLLTLHIDGDRIVDLFGKRHGWPDIERLDHIARVEVSVDVDPGGGLEKEVAYGSPSSARKWGEEVRGGAVADLVRWRALMFPLEQAEDIRGLRLSPVGVVEGKDNRRIMHNMKFGGSTETGGSGSENATTE